MSVVEESLKRSATNPKSLGWREVSEKSVEDDIRKEKESQGAAQETLKEQNDSRRKRCQIIRKDMQRAFFIWDENVTQTLK